MSNKRKRRLIVVFIDDFKQVCMSFGKTLSKSIHKLFDILAVLCVMLFFIFAMVIDSSSNTPLYICLGSSIYLLVYVLLKTIDIENIDIEEDDTCQ